ncbi:unnamed protein product [Clonostachys rhizophaga]|uniref:Glycosyl transferase CAP10 domain-containing protein n=1 Tax=Clonostachys rhizophaga TaxID=160324 RepID=A0A9N9VCH8_9HYPO|nr:unnamed protein product [Clonostachys rhizophaga]
MRRTQCAQVGASAFLPFCVLLIDAAIRYWSIDYTKLETFSKSAPRQQWKSPVLTYGLLSLTWSVAAMLAVDSARVKTGTICLVGTHMEAHTPFLQVVLCVMDGIIIAELSSLRRGPGEEPVDISKFFSMFCLVASGFMAIIALFFMIFSTQQLHLSSVARRDLFLDTLMASVAIACAKTLLTWLHPTTVAMLTTGLTLFGYRFRALDSSLILPPLSQAYVFQTAAMTTGLAGAWFAMVFYSKSAPRSPTTVLLHRCLVLGYMAAVALFITFSIFFSTNKIHVSLPASVRRLTHAAQSSAEIWQSQAKMSKTLDEAVTQYQNRHFLPPPPNFDKWYEFATNRSSQVIDSFGQIFDDLIPYWGLEPAEIRARTAHLSEFPEMGMAALQIRNGTLRQSPHIPGTHHWMTDSIEKMMEPFIQYLPDMDFVINLADECRVLPRYEDFWDLRSKGRAAQNKVAQRWKGLQENRNVEGGGPFRTWTNNTEWPQDFAEPRKNPDGSFAASSHFVETIRKQLYYKWIADACPPESVARQSRWWDWSTLCMDCIEPHSELTTGGAVMAHNPPPGGICYQPDLAYLSGFIRSQTQATTKTLLPVFSQARVDGFADILFPSPWNFVDKTEYREDTDIEWGRKGNSLFWRGSSSDGIARDGGWKGFLRARAVHESYQEAGKGSRDAITPRVNVSFAGEIHKCDSPDCGHESEMFNLWSGAVKPEGETEEGYDLGRASAPFEEHWRHRHLLDMDGAGFSGRFIPFLESRSLPHRAALFLAWFDERLQEWQHYVPVDTRLGRGFWAVLDFLSSSEVVVDDAGFRQTGDEMAERIAEQGRDWAKRALRKEDMQIYMFRLLLEYGRVVSDDREALGYTGTGIPDW